METIAKMYLVESGVCPWEKIIEPHDAKELSTLSVVRVGSRSEWGSFVDDIDAVLKDYGEPVRWYTCAQTFSGNRLQERKLMQRLSSSPAGFEKVAIDFHGAGSIPSTASYLSLPLTDRHIDVLSSHRRELVVLPSEVPVSLATVLDMLRPYAKGLDPEAIKALAMQYKEWTFLRCLINEDTHVCCQLIGAPKLISQSAFRLKERGYQPMEDREEAAIALH